MPLNFIEPVPVSAPPGVITQQWGTQLPDGIQHHGVRIFPSRGFNRIVLHLRGGSSEDRVSLGDQHISVLEQMATWNDPVPDGTTKYGIVAPALRGCDPDIWTGGLGSEGVDGFGDINTDVADLPLLLDAQRDSPFPAKPEFKNGLNLSLQGYSAGALRACVALRWKVFTNIKCVVMRAPLINIYDWESLPLGERQGLIDTLGFQSIASTTFEDLQPYEKQLLWDRSPYQWAQELPKIPTLIIQAENDETVPAWWVAGFANKLELAGVPVTHKIIRGATHGFSEPEHALESLELTQEFLRTHTI